MWYYVIVADAILGTGKTHEAAGIRLI